MSAALLLPLLSSVVYVCAALLIKRSTELGMDVWRTVFITNLLSALLFAPILLLGGAGQPLHQLWQPAAVALLMVLGQVLVVLALSRGDVSVATPVLGIKTIFVAFFTLVMLAESLGTPLWLGAVLSASAIFCFNLPRNRSEPGRASFTIICSVAAAAVFALFDVLVQKWSPLWGIGRFLPAMMGLTALFSIGLVPMFTAPLSSIPSQARGWLFGGAALMGIQGLILISTIALFGNATAVNIVYNTRGLFSVVLVWLAGHWFENTEQHLSRKILGARLAGATMMMAAILLVLVQ
jgi:drug/metabolite transporter (DMT)-like permease